MRFLVREKRASIVEYEIEAKSQLDAERREGEIQYEMEIDNYGDDLISVEEVSKQ